MSKKLYTIDELRELNRGDWKHKIIIPKNIDETKKYQIAATWDDSGNLDGKWWKVLDEKLDLTNYRVKYHFNLC